MSGHEPCPTCPWRRTSTVGGSDIPNFDICLMRGLSRTVGEGDDFRPIMACHYSGDLGDERPCIGYLAVEGWSNLNARMLAINGRLDIAAAVEASVGLNLWPSFHEMLNAYETAHQPSG